MDIYDVTLPPNDSRITSYNFKLQIHSTKSKYNFSRSNSLSSNENRKSSIHCIAQRKVARNKDLQVDILSG